MDPFTIGAIISGAGSIANIVGNLMNAAKTEEDVNNVIAALDKLNIPGGEEIKAKFVDNVAKYKPELVTQNAYDSIQLDPQSRDAQIKALKNLAQRSEEGYGASTRAALAQSDMEAAQQAKAQRDAAQQSYAARGQASGGGQMLASMLANQQGANTRFMRGMGIAANEDAAKMQALQNYANLGGQIRGQDYGEQSNRAQAANQIAQFNAGLSQQAGMADYNTRANQAMQNAQIANNMAQFNRGEQWRRYGAQVNRATLPAQLRQGSNQTNMQALYSVTNPITQLGSAVASGGFGAPKRTGSDMLDETGWG